MQKRKHDETIISMNNTFKKGQIWYNKKYDKYVEIIQCTGPLLITKVEGCEETTSGILDEGLKARLDKEDVVLAKPIFRYLYV